jgi:hypothetical protein
MGGGGIIYTKLYIISAHFLPEVIVFKRDQSLDSHSFSSVAQMACCKTGPSSTLGSAPHGGSALDMEMGLGETL